MKNIRNKARQVRRDQTDAEKALWARLRNRQVYSAKFRRQHPIGPFIADFCCLQQRLIVELDAGQHAVETVADQKCSQFLADQGYRVLRFWNHEVLNHSDAVMERIAETLGERSPSPQSSPRGRGSNRQAGEKRIEGPLTVG